MLKKKWNDFIGKSETEKPLTPTNVVDAKEELRDAIVAYFRNSYLTVKEINGDFVIWVSDNQAKYQAYISKEDFKNDLYAELDNRQLNAVSRAGIVFKAENPPQGFEEITKGVYIQFLVKGGKIKKSEKVYAKAKITVVKSKGSLMKAKYILNAEKQTEYNIGRGTENNNHIVIKNDNNTANSAINNCVSRQHARIVFIADKGFYLQSRNETNRTFINRNGQRAEDLADLSRKVRLQHNDEIELGKSVCLKFEVID